VRLAETPVIAAVTALRAREEAKTGEWQWENEKAVLLLVVADMAEDDGIANVRVWRRRQGRGHGSIELH
jgi:hypothetical protein